MKPTQDDIIRMAVQCQLVNAGNRDGLYMDALEKFARLAYEAGRADENEACAVIAFNAKTYLEAATAIRARREQ